MENDPGPVIPVKRMGSAAAPVLDAEQKARMRARIVPKLAQVHAETILQKERSSRWTRGVMLLVAAMIPFTIGAVSMGRWYSAKQVAPQTAEKATHKNARVVALHGPIEISQEGKEQKGEAGVDINILPGAKISTAQGSDACVLLASGALVTVSENSRIVLDEESDSKENLTLALGQVYVEVPPLGHYRSLQIGTGQALVTVHGTKFTVKALRADQNDEAYTEVEVTEGLVAVDSKSERTFLPAGSKWSSKSTSQVIPTPPGGVDGASGSSVVGSNGSAIGPVGGSNAAAPLDNVGEREAKRNQDGQKNGSIKPESKEPSESSSLAQENELFQRAMAASRSGNDKMAVQLLDELLAKYPASPLAQNARVERIRAFKRLGETSSAAKESRKYLADHPEGFASDEARKAVVPPTSSTKKLILVPVV